MMSGMEAVVLGFPALVLGWVWVVSHAAAPDPKILMLNALMRRPAAKPPAGGGVRRMTDGNLS
jgi:hypothetical protein